MKLAKAQRKKVQKLVRPIFKECPRIHSVSRTALHYQLNGIDIPYSLWLTYISSNMELDDESKSWLLESGLRVEDVIIFRQRCISFFYQYGDGDFSFQRKKEGAN